MARWIDGGEVLSVGDVGFLIRRCPQRGVESWYLQDTPGRTNLSHEPRLRGWLGETNNVSCYAHGLAKVARVARNFRALVVPLDGPARTAALAELGWPELDPVE